MASDAYTLRIGAIQCTPVSDDSLPYPPSLFFANVLREQLEEELGARRLYQGHGLSFPIPNIGARGLATGRRLGVGTGVLTGPLRISVCRLRPSRLKTT